MNRERKVAIVWEFFLILALSLAAEALCGCPPAPVPPPPPPPNLPACQRAGMRLLDLGCPAGRPTPKGESFEEVCNKTQASGYAELNPDCLAAIMSCDDVKKCAR